MKVIFLQDVPGVAKIGDVKDVSNGYARNFLIPRQLALLASSGAMNTVKAQIEHKVRSEARTEAELLELANRLDGEEITLEARTGLKDQLYGSITAADIASEIERSTGLAVDKRKIDLSGPIRKIGSYQLAIRLTKDIIPKITVTVNEKTA
jgi:large subunit ribosomal protein L9